MRKLILLLLGTNLSKNVGGQMFRPFEPPLGGPFRYQGHSD